MVSAPPVVTRKRKNPNPLIFNNLKSRQGSLPATFYHEVHLIQNLEFRWLASNISISYDFKINLSLDKLKVKDKFVISSDELMNVDTSYLE